MSEQQVLQAVRANSMAMNARVPDQYAHTFTEDLVWEGDHLPAPVIGRQAAVQVMGAFWSAFPDLHFEVEREFASGDQAAICWRVTGTHQGDFVGISATGNRVTMEAIHIFRFDGGRMAEHWVARDDLGMMQQLGVVPSPGRAET